jgi:hypothetical protein
MSNKMLLVVILAIAAFGAAWLPARSETVAAHNSTMMPTPSPTPTPSPGSTPDEPLPTPTLAPK